MKRNLLFLLMTLVLPIGACAYDAYINGIYYNFSGNEAEVTSSNNPSSYSRILVIPEFVGKDEKTYRVTSIGEDAFFDCRTLTSITIPIYLTHIGSGAFYLCKSLTEVHIKDMEAWCKITFGESHSNPLYYAKHLYMNGQEIKDLTIPDSIAIINNYAFYNCSDLKTITLPGSITSIGHDAFYGCSSLTDVYCDANEVPEAVSSAFPYASLRSATLHVPAGSIDKYKAQSPWSRFGNIVAMPTLDPVTFTEGQMATIILPTNPDASKGKYYRLDRYEDGQIIFEQELQPQAHIPYIIVPNEDFSINLRTLDLAGCYRDTVSVAGTSFIGSYVSETFDYPDGFYIDFIDITSDCRFDESCVIGALRAYLLVRWDDPYNQGGTRVPPLNKREIVLRDDETGITSSLEETGKGAVIYNLAGQRLSNPQKGIYIKKGKKVLR